MIKVLKVLFAIFCIICFVFLGVYIGERIYGRTNGKLGFLDFFGNKNSEVSIISENYLKNIIETSDLYVYQCSYDDICTVVGDDKKVEYYVTYESTVKLGFDFKKIDFEVSEENNSKIIKVNVPQIEIKDINVDINSLDFIFKKAEANNKGTIMDAYNKCIEDVTDKVEKNRDIYDFAKENTDKIINAMLEPVIKADSENMNYDYKIIINYEGEK